jgi:hypothetical protein
MGNVYYPNGRSSKDYKNNVERVRRRNVPVNTQFILTVTATNLSTASQKFSLVVTGCFVEGVPPVTPSPTPGDGVPTLAPTIAGFQAPTFAPTVGASTAPTTAETENEFWTNAIAWIKEHVIFSVLIGIAFVSIFCGGFCCFWICRRDARLRRERAIFAARASSLSERDRMRLSQLGGKALTGPVGQRLSAIELQQFDGHSEVRSAAVVPKGTTSNKNQTPSQNMHGGPRPPEVRENRPPPVSPYFSGSIVTLSTWHCAACTFINDESTDPVQCSVCQTPRRLTTGRNGANRIGGGVAQL